MIVTDTETLDDLATLRFVARDFFASVDPHAGIEEEARVDRALWSRACTELDAAGVDVPERLGGSAIGGAGLAVLAEEAGRALARVPLLGSVVLAQGALVAADDAVTATWLPRLLSGASVAAVGLTRGSLVAAPAADEVDGSAPAGWTLTGETWPVMDVVSADLLLLVAATDDGPTAFLVEVDAPGVVRSPSRSLDLTRDAGRVVLTGAPATRLGAAGGWPRLFETLQPRLDLVVAAEALGSSEACLAAAVDHARDRVQFGRAIGSFQAIKHRLADLAVLVDDARSALEHASWAADEAPDQAPLAAAIAAAAAVEAHLQATADAVQVHGGIGFTWEHPDHLHVRRAQSLALLYGDLPQRRERVLRLMGV